MDTASRYFSPHVLAVGIRQREIKVKAEEHPRGRPSY
jgi:hypothetical protein